MCDIVFEKAKGGKVSRTSVYAMVSLKKVL